MASTAATLTVLSALRRSDSLNLPDHRKLSNKGDMIELASWDNNVSLGEDDLHPAARLDGVTGWLDAKGCKMVGSKMAEKGVERLSDIGLDAIFYMVILNYAESHVYSLALALSLQVLSFPLIHHIYHSFCKSYQQIPFPTHRCHLHYASILALIASQSLHKIVLHIEL
ncbi:hypothetical protein Tco_0300897 [Tanacetum coccineum]